MFDIGFSELLLIFIIGLIVLGPQKLPIAIRTVVGWIRTLRGIASNVQNELAQELKLQELQESIKKAEELNVSKLSPELAKTVEDLKTSATKMHSELHQQGKELKSQLEPNKATTTIPPVPPADAQAEMAEEDDSKLEFEQDTDSQIDLSSYDPLADPEVVSPTSESNTTDSNSSSNQAKTKEQTHSQQSSTS